eukprot:4738581-Lingulodinium_polyedra.AAC.1
MKGTAATNWRADPATVADRAKLPRSARAKAKSEDKARKKRTAERAMKIKALQGHDPLAVKA